jgi:hypothetical protein
MEQKLQKHKETLRDTFPVKHFPFSERRTLREKYGNTGQAIDARI